MPDYYLLQVRNTTEAVGEYALQFLANRSVGDSLHVDAGDADVALRPASSLAQAYFQPIGDLDGDGFGDFVGSALTDGSSHQAEIYFGSASPSGAIMEQHKLTLHLPAPLLPSSDAGPHSTIITGDFNQDGRLDIVVGVSNDAGPEAYLILGRSGGFGSHLDVQQAADLRIDLGSSGPVEITNAGDLNGDGVDDIAIALPEDSLAPGDPSGIVRIFYGTSSWQAAERLIQIDFTDPSGAASLEGFVIDNTPSGGQWGLTQSRSSSAPHSLYFGSDGSYDIGARTAGDVLSPIIPLSTVGSDREMTLSLKAGTSTILR